MRRILAILIAMVVVGSIGPASAMTFHVVKTASGARVVMATGSIEHGDARKFAAALERASRDKHGTRKLLLDSPGGFVADALLMADIMDEIGVTTVVPKGAICASACASILFVSGKYRTVEAGGALAIHSCYDGRSGAAMRGCNALISAHAEAEGVSGEAMMALQEAAGSDSVFVFDKAGAACFGLTLQPGARPSRKPAPCIAEAMKGRRKK